MQSLRELKECYVTDLEPNFSGILFFLNYVTASQITSQYYCYVTDVTYFVFRPNDSTIHIIKKNRSSCHQITFDLASASTPAIFLCTTQERRNLFFLPLNYRGLADSPTGLTLFFSFVYE